MGERPRQKRFKTLVVWGTLGLVAGCCVALGAMLAYSAALPGTGLSGQVCAGFTTVPHLRVGVAWYSPISSNLPLLMISPYRICVDVPYAAWGSILPSISGEWVFPP